MNIGFVSAWFERGAGYVTKLYTELLKNNNNKIYVYARAGDIVHPTEGWNQDYVTWGRVLPFTRISWLHFKKWIIKNNIDTLFFNEQRDFRIIYQCKIEFPDIKIGSYIDYYTEDMIPKFKYYDFLICNTLRHQSVFSWHEQSYYVPWGTDVDLYVPAKGNYELVDKDKVTFFHSAGMSNRKGTNTLLDVFLNTDLCEKSKLIIHAQTSIENFTNVSKEELNKKNVVFIQKTVGAPGLYYLGDVYVYPTTLDGLGLTMYEALSSGLPLIISNNAPMNEIVDETIGSFVSIEKYCSREDGYYWPLCFVKKDSLYTAMNEYASNPDLTIQKKRNARLRAVEKLNLKNRSYQVQDIFEHSEVLYWNKEELKQAYKKEQKRYFTLMRMNLEMLMPSIIVDHVNSFVFWKKEKLKEGEKT